MAKRRIYQCPTCNHKFKNFKWRKVLFSIDIDEEACCPQCHTPARLWPKITAKKRKENNMASKCTKCGNTESYNFALNIGLCNPCIGERIEELEAENDKIRRCRCCEAKEQIEELEIENGKLNIILYHRENGLSHADFKAEIEISKQSERINNLKAVLQGMVPFIEDDFPIGTGTNHGTCASDEYQQACDAVIQVLKGE